MSADVGIRTHFYHRNNKHHWYFFNFDTDLVYILIGKLDLKFKKLKIHKIRNCSTYAFHL